MAVCMSCGLVSLLVVVISLLYFLVRHKFSYWSKRNVLQSPPSFPLGNCQGISRTRNLGHILKQTYLESKGRSFAGFYIFLSPNLLIRDPKLVRYILNKDFSTFNSRGFRVDKEKDPLTGHLFFLDGPEWRTLRAKLTPAFTSGKMRMMFPIIENCCEEMKTYLLSTKNKSSLFDVSDVFMRYTTNVITRCAFGLDVDFFKNPDPMFEKMVHRVGNPNFLDAVKRGLAFSLGLFFKKLPFRLMPQDLSDYFINLVENAMKTRRTSGVERKDFLQLLMQLIDWGWLDDVDAPKDSDQPKLDYHFGTKEAAAQAFSFVMGGFDTSGTTMQCCLYELALNPNIQTKVREEIQKVISTHGGTLTYECLQELVYLDQVINETLRKHPVVPFVQRECARNYKIPDSDVLLEPGMKVWISASGMHSDPELFPEPEIFDPERFSSENKSNIVPFTYLPFGEGPRSCIGSRFAMMQMKLGISSLLNEFVVQNCQETPIPPLKLDPKKALTLVMGGVPLKLVPL